MALLGSTLDNTSLTSVALKLVRDMTKHLQSQVGSVLGWCEISKAKHVSHLFLLPGLAHSKFIFDDLHSFSGSIPLKFENKLRRHKHDDLEKIPPQLY